MNELTKTEQSELVQHEAVIRKGLATFLDVGLSLKHIRDHKLYRQDFDTFELYLRCQWQMDRSYAHRLIDAVEVNEQIKMLPIGNKFNLQNESQARELVKVPDEELPAVVDKAVELAGDKPPTAKDLKSAREAVSGELLAPESSEPKPKRPEWKDAKLKAVKTGEAFIRAIDDLDELRPHKSRGKAVELGQGSLEIVRDW